MTTKAHPKFELVEFTPIGYKIPIYPVQHCAVCRGFLNKPCGSCIENKIKECPVTPDENSYYHKHCYDIMNENLPPKKNSQNNKPKFSNNDYLLDSE